MKKREREEDLCKKEWEEKTKQVKGFRSVRNFFDVIRKIVIQLSNCRVIFHLTLLMC